MKALRIVPLLALAALPMVVPPAVAVEPSATGGRALIIGIDDYANPRLKLQGSRQDAEHMQRFAVEKLGMKPDHVRVLLNDEATAKSILNSIDQFLIAPSRPGERLLLYFSGHGHHVADQDGDEKSGPNGDPNDARDEILVTYDTEVSGREAVGSFIRDDELRLRIMGASDRQFIVIVDSCHSGTMTRSLDDGDGAAVRSPFIMAEASTRSAIPDPVSRDIYQEVRKDREGMGDGATNVITWTAVSATQLAHVDQSTQPPSGGVFTNAFLRGIEKLSADKSRNGKVSHAELLAYVRQQSEEYCLKFSCRNALTPTLEGPPDIMARDVITLARDNNPVQATLDQMAPSIAAKVEVGIGLADGDNCKDAALRVGDELLVCARSPVKGHLLLLDLRDDGDTVILFPNVRSRDQNIDDRIDKAQALVVPDLYDKFILTADQAGSGSILALVTSDRVPLDELEAHIRRTKSEQGVVAEVADRDAFLGATITRLMQPWTGNETGNRAVRWAAGHKRYTIQP